MQQQVDTHANTIATAHSQTAHLTTTNTALSDELNTTRATCQQQGDQITLQGNEIAQLLAKVASPGDGYTRALRSC